MSEDRILTKRQALDLALLGQKRKAEEMLLASLGTAPPWEAGSETAVTPFDGTASLWCPGCAVSDRVG